jgi:4-hydroxy-3-polyprenylbenzoate decarboxylase
MTWQDFREFLVEVERRGELERVRGADGHLEIGTLVELNAERDGPLLLFEDIKDHVGGPSIAAKPYQTASRAAVALGLPTDVPPFEMFRVWRERIRGYEAIPPVMVTGGPVMDNVFEGDGVDLTRFPVPLWHEQDGGPYIGTGCSVITRDPEIDEVNAGTYRCQLHDARTLGVDIAPNHGGNLHLQRWWAGGASAPVAVAITPDPYLFCASTQSVPGYTNEFEYAGFLKGGPIELLEAPLTGLPIPANAEMILEGEVPPPSVEQREEGPFGEYTGYYGGGRKMAPVIRVRAVYHRDAPILQGDPPLKPPAGHGHWGGMPISGSLTRVWDALDRSGVPGVTSVYALPVGSNLITVVAVDQRYAGHAVQVGTVTSGLLSNMCRAVIVVDDDIDISNTEEVMWAIATRTDPAESIEIMRGCRSGSLDPIISPERKARREYTASRAIIVAVRPWTWRDQFPAVNRGSDELRAQVRAKWADLLSR